MAAAAQPKPVAPAAEPWARVEALPCLLTVEIPVPGFTVSDLVHLEPGRIIATRWTVGQDVPLRINGELIANLVSNGRMVSAGIVQISDMRSGVWSRS